VALRSGCIDGRIAFVSPDAKHSGKLLAVMSDNSKIEWTDATWNPVRGCTKVSAGCVHCYAETFAERFRGVAGHPFEFGFDLRLIPEKLGDPIRWSKPKKIFVNSMSDLFHEDVPDEYMLKVKKGHTWVQQMRPWPKHLLSPEQPLLGAAIGAPCSRCALPTRGQADGDQK
jgi:Protein of unknown function (DUF5131)